MRLPDGRRLRIDRIDCPETGRPGAAAARDLAARFVAAGPASLCPREPPADRYGRLLGDLEVGGERLSAVLVAAGLAWRYRCHDADLLRLQERAVHQRLGVHSVLDHPCCQGPLRLTDTSFHRPDCGLLATGGREYPLAFGAEQPLASGLAPCRHCLAWPPAPPGAPPLGPSLAAWSTAGPHAP